MEELQEFLPETEKEYETNTMARRSSEKTFELASETVIDICNIFISEKKLRQPQDNRDSVKRLMEQKILEEKLGGHLMDMIGFRNLLVHQYGKIDDEIVFEAITEELEKDVKNFISIIQKIS